MTPEISHAFFLAHDQVRAGTLTRYLREGCERAIRNRFHQRRMADEGHALELPFQIATTKKRAAIETTDDAVIVNQAHHRHRVNRTLGQKLEQRPIHTVAMMSLI